MDNQARAEQQGAIRPLRNTWSCFVQSYVILMTIAMSGFIIYYTNRKAYEDEFYRNAYYASICGGSLVLVEFCRTMAEHFIIPDRNYYHKIYLLTLLFEVGSVVSYYAFYNYYSVLCGVSVFYYFMLLHIEHRFSIRGQLIMSVEE